MAYLSRESAPFSDELWASIDQAVVEAAKEILVGRRFMPFFGPVGPGLNAAEIASPEKEESFKDGVSIMEGRRLVRVPQLYEDFWLYWRDIEGSGRVGFPVDMSAARIAAQKLARREDQMIFYGLKAYGLEGLITAKGVGGQALGDWGSGEESFVAVAQALSTLSAKGKFGRYALALSPDLYIALHRIQSGTGLLELDRIKNMIGGNVFNCSALEAKTGLLICAQPQYMDLMVGLDISVAYSELVDLNHHLRILETALVRVKDPEAIIVFK